MPPAADLRASLARCGSDVVIDEGVTIEHPELVEVGDRVRIGRGFMITGTARITLGDDCTLMPYGFVQGAGTLTVADHVTFYPYSYLSIGGATGVIDIGHHTHFAPGCALYGAGLLTIGAHVNVASHTVLTTVQHDPTLTPGVPMSQTSEAKPITIADDVWFGANAVAVPGVSIATGCIVGAGAVVTRDTEPYGVYVGIPARRQGDRRPARPRSLREPETLA